MSITLNSGKLILACADLDARPLFWTDDFGQRFGYEPAVATLVAQRLNLEIEWRFLRWSDFVVALQSGEVDAIWCGCAITTERQRKCLFSRPYAHFNESVQVRANSGVSQFQDLRGKRVGAISGSTYMALAEQWPGCERIGFDGTSDDVFLDMINALSRGDIDAVVDEEPAFGAQRDNSAFEIAFTVATNNPWGVAMRKNQLELKKELDHAIRSLTQTGAIVDCWNKNLTDITCPTPLLPDC